MDTRRFNRGALFNAAVSYALRKKIFGLDEIICLHDVDLLVPAPLSDEYLRQLPEHTVRHIGTIPRYQSMGNAYFGGIVMLRVEDYVAVGGHDNTYWGWGGEDKDFKKRVRRANLAIEFARGEVIDLEDFAKYSQKIQHNKVTLNCGRHLSKTNHLKGRESTIDNVAFSCEGLKEAEILSQPVYELDFYFD